MPTDNTSPRPVNRRPSCAAAGRFAAICLRPSGASGGWRTGWAPTPLAQWPGGLVGFYGGRRRCRNPGTGVSDSSGNRGLARRRNPLRHRYGETAARREVVLICDRELLTSCGLRSLAPRQGSFVPTTSAMPGNAMAAITRDRSRLGCWAITRWPSIECMATQPWLKPGWSRSAIICEMPAWVWSAKFSMAHRHITRAVPRRRRDQWPESGSLAAAETDQGWRGFSPSRRLRWPPDRLLGLWWAVPQ